MQLLYILSLGHSGSTLLDCMLGTHQDFFSSGEMRYLNWQLERVKSETSSIENQNVCSCGLDFSVCPFWSKVFEKLHEKSGVNIVDEPTLFDTAYFNAFSYKERGGFKIGLTNKLKELICRESLNWGCNLPFATMIEPNISKWVSNNWLLYETISEVSHKEYIVDSSKSFTRALLLQRYHPNDVHFIFIHRNVDQLIRSAQKRSAQRIMTAAKTWYKKRQFSHAIETCKRRIPDFKYIEVDYADIASHPSDVLDSIVAQFKVSPIQNRQPNEQFYVDPAAMHLVAGNPMRYRGKQLVQAK